MSKQFSILRLSLISTLLILGILLASPVLADPAIDPPPATEQENSLITKYAALLQQGNYAELDKETNQIQKDFENGKLNDVGLLHPFRAFYDANPALEEKYNAWIAAYPKSYAAFESRAIYYRRVAYQARGTNYIDKTSGQQISTMEAYLRKAMADSTMAVHLTAKPVLSYFDIISVAKLVGDRQTADKMLNETIKVDPKNFIVRYKYMLNLETRWGGSLEKMKEFRKEAQDAGLTAEQLSYLDERISDEINFLAQQNNHSAPGTVGN